MPKIETVISKNAILDFYLAVFGVLELFKDSHFLWGFRGLPPRRRGSGQRSGRAGEGVPLHLIVLRNRLWYHQLNTFLVGKKMIVSTRGRYALRVMIDLAENGVQERIPLKEIAERQNISQKYIEAIMTLLSKNSFVDAVHGKGGGYKLNRKPEEYKVGEILRLTEGTLAPVACLEENAEPCPRKDECRTIPMWTKLDDLIENYLDTVTLADLMRK